MNTGLVIAAVTLVGGICATVRSARKMNWEANTLVPLFGGLLTSSVSLFTAMIIVVWS